MIFLGIGSNLSSSFGDRFKNIDLSINFLLQNKINLLKKSSFYETYSYPNREDPKFINVVVSVDTNLSPIDLMKVLISIEEKLERKRNKKNDPRTCDLDIIDYKKQVINFKTFKKNFLLIFFYQVLILHLSLRLKNGMVNYIQILIFRQVCLLLILAKGV